MKRIANCRRGGGPAGDCFRGQRLAPSPTSAPAHRQHFTTRLSRTPPDAQRPVGLGLPAPGTTPRLIGSGFGSGYPLLPTLPARPDPQGYGTGSLDRDAADLRLLCAHLRQQHGIRGVVLVGHSTGCQDAVRYMQRYCGAGPGAAAAPGAGQGGGDAAPAAAGVQEEAEGEVAELLGTVLQAPVRVVGFQA